MSEKRTTIQSADNALDILIALHDNRNMSIRDLGDVLNISKSTLHRTLQTLENKGFVRKDIVSEKYSLGYKILELSESLKKDLEIRNIAYKYMEELRDLIGETIQLAILDDDSILIIETVEGTNDLRLFSRAGKRYPITYGNFGRVFLSALSIEKIRSLIEQYPLKQYASKSIVDPNEYIDKVKIVKKQGFSSTMDDPIEGAYSVAAPIYNSQGEMIASLAIAGVKQFQGKFSQSELEKMTQQYAANISKEFK